MLKISCIAQCLILARRHTPRNVGAGWVNGGNYERSVLALSLLAGLAGCATPPDKIAGVPNSGPCTAADRQRLAVISNQQNKSASGDALGVFLIGVPLASMSGGDHEAEIAILKGRCGPPKT
ncbi:hypothetical protein X730_18695 [Mesorhizobium sp. L103C565B0]|nr:hypothetical protein X730_18695 [Mesorhizobium sp. L103C565B0]